jgi:ATP-binding cassette subfamily B protein
MADFFETDDIVKGYDSAIAKRILSYISPYRNFAILAFLALAISTAGELMSPVIVRQSIDRSLMVSWYGFSPAAAGEKANAVLKLSNKDPIINGRIYVRTSRLAGLSGAERSDLERKGYYFPQEMYVFKVDPSNLVQKSVLESNPTIFTIDGNQAAISVEKLRKLPADEAFSLRAKDEKTIRTYAILLMLILVVILAATFVMTYFTNLIGIKIMKDIRMQLFGHTLSRSLSFLSRQPVGRLVTRITSDVETINQFFTDVLSAFIKDASIMIGSLIVLFFFDYRLAFVVTATLPAIVVISNVSRKHVREAFRNQRQWTSKVNAYIAEHLAGIEVVKLFVKEETAKQEFAAHDEELMKANLEEMYVYATFRPSVDFLATFTSALVLVVGAWLYLTHTISLGTLIAFVNLIGMFYSPIKDMAEKYILLQSAMAGGERIFKLLDADETIPDKPKIEMPSSLRGHIEFNKVWFAYKESEWVLKDVSFTVEPGQMIAIVGYTGAGKTTIANLITRFWDIQKGSIRVDGLSIGDLPLQGLRHAIQPVPQDVFLFSGTISENIRLGEDVTTTRMKIAAGAVHADEFIEALPLGYDTVLSEGGNNLSQGQRQLLSFARVLAHDPDIIILDEATSSVDTETERLIQRGIEGLLTGRTSIVIAHRLSTIRHADKIIVLSQGRITETGTHDELIMRKALYWNLYQLQNSGIL